MDFSVEGSRLDDRRPARELKFHRTEPGVQNAQLGIEAESQIATGVQKDLHTISFACRNPVPCPNLSARHQLFPLCTRIAENHWASFDIVQHTRPGGNKMLRELVRIEVHRE